MAVIGGDNVRKLLRLRFEGVTDEGRHYYWVYGKRRGELDASEQVPYNPTPLSDVLKQYRNDYSQGYKVGYDSEQVAGQF